MSLGYTNLKHHESSTERIVGRLEDPVIRTVKEAYVPPYLSAGPVISVPGHPPVMMGEYRLCGGLSAVAISIVAKEDPLCFVAMKVEGVCHRGLTVYFVPEED